MSKCGCPGSKMMDFRKDQDHDKDPGHDHAHKHDHEHGEHDDAAAVQSQLRQWPVQLHLVSPEAPYYQGADVLLAADCVAYAMGDFHKRYLKGKSLAIACPKLDEGQDEYIEKITSLIDDAKINTLTVLIMQVPCCHGLLDMAKQAASKAKRKVPVKYAVVSLQGEILEENWA